MFLQVSKQTFSFDFWRSYEVSREEEKEEGEGSSKNKLAFLDLLIESYHKKELSRQDIVEEVNTFMFEGHDTVATNIAFCLHLLSSHPELQNKVQASAEWSSNSRMSNA